MSKNVIKSDGHKEPFNTEKLIRSLERVGAGQDTISEILYELRKQENNHLTTSKIFNKAHSLLRKKELGPAGRYKLKNAIMDLGPSGYPFEAFVGEILKNQGYTVRVGVEVEGYCVKHEVDVMADKGDNNYLVECKFHNSHGYATDVKVPLYIKSRFDDIEKNLRNTKEYKSKKHFGWIFTNTRFSDDAMKYGKCVGLKLVSWDYPQNGSLRQIIDNSDLHPITCLSSLSNKEKKVLLEKNIVLCKQLEENLTVLAKVGINSRKLNEIKREMKDVIKSD